MAKRSSAPRVEPGFSGFPREGFKFLRSLRENDYENNSKAWFDEHRDTYKKALRQPLCRLVEDLVSVFEAEQLNLTGDVKRSLFRINRDVRFSKNKLPYNCHVSAALSRSGSRKDGSGKFYIHIEPDNCFAATGFFQPEMKNITAMREDIIDDPKTILNTVQALKKHGHQLETGGSLKRFPRGFEPTGDEQLDDLLKLKSFIVFQPLDESAFYSDAVMPLLQKFAVETKALRAFGNAALDLRDDNEAAAP